MDCLAMEVILTVNSYQQYYAVLHYYIEIVW